MAQKTNTKILLTGGHAHATAYAVVKEIKKEHPSTEIYWIGPKTLVEGKNISGIEDKVFKELGVRVVNINAGRLQVKLTRYTLLSLLKVPLGFVQALVAIVKIRPNITVSFGGFVGLPVVLVSKMFGIPVIIQEQTVAAGRANIIAAKYANLIAISRPESSSFFPEGKTVVIGNPVDESILNIKRKKSLSSKKAIFITGGHTGSKPLNNLIYQALPNLLAKYNIIHQTGKEDFDRFAKFKKNLTQNKGKYQVYENIDPRNWPKTLAVSDVVVSRAGANTVSQLLALSIPSLLIPIPHTYQDEQIKNASFAVDWGIARMLEQDAATPEKVIREIDGLFENWEKIVKKSENKRSPDLDASKKFVKLIFNEVQTTKKS